MCYEAGGSVELQLFPEDLLCEGLAAEAVKWPGPLCQVFI